MAPDPRPSEAETFPPPDLPGTRPPADPDETATVGPVGGTAIPSAPSSGRSFGDYELLDEIARGGMGVVYKARQVSLNRVVALKMILAGQLASATDVQRFRAEAEAAAALDHQNILPIYEVGEHAGQHYFSMKLVDGGSLAGRVAELLNEPKTAVGIVTKVCRAVDFAHRRGVLHRDLKPANVLLDKDGSPYVTDFGLAKKVEGDSGLTQSGAIVGTPSYMAPEQARAEKQLTTAADVYALGAILYELLTGRPPFRAGSVVDTILQVLDREPDSPSAINPKAGRDLSVIALKCLRKEPGRRYESAASVADDLDHWSRGEPILARPVGRVERGLKWVRRNPVVAGLLVAVGVAIVGGTTATYVKYRDEARQRAVADETAGRLRGTLAELERVNAEQAQTVRQLEEEKAATENAFLDGLLRPLRVETGLETDLKPEEAKTLAALAAVPDERLRMRFVERGLASPAGSAKLAIWPAEVAWAVVGPDREAAGRLRDLVRREMMREPPDPPSRWACARLGAILPPGDRELDRRTAAMLAERQASETDYPAVIVTRGAYRSAIVR
jgi:tRNA A-37 threonylcarbamoyl transferase component Bud32